MKSHKEIRLLSAILLFVASAIMFFSIVFVKGIPAIEVFYAIVGCGAFTYVGVSLLVFKEKMRLLNIVSFAIIMMINAIPFFVLIGQLIDANALPTTVEPYVALGAALTFVAITVIMFTNSIKRFNMFLTYVILSLVYVGATITYFVLVPESVDSHTIFAMTAEVLALLGFGVAFLYYKDVDANGAKEKACICTRREIAKVELAKKNLELLKSLAEMQKDGTITQKEFDAKKADLL